MIKDRMQAKLGPGGKKSDIVSNQKMFDLSYGLLEMQNYV